MAKTKKSRSGAKASRKSARKTTRKKPNRKPVRKTAKRTVPSKKVRKEIKTLRKGLKKEIALTKKVGKKTSQHDVELAKLKVEMANLTKKPGSKKKQLSEYNLFIRRQLKSGKTFKQAVAIWKLQKQLEKGTLRKRRAPKPQIIIVKAKPKARKKPAKKKIKRKKPVKKRKPVKRKIKRKVKRKIKRKPRKKPVKRKIKRKIRRKPRKKPVIKPVVKTRTITKTHRVIVEKPVFPVAEFSAMFERVAEKMKPQHTIIKSEDSLAMSDEEVAYRIVGLYFQDIARVVVKRRLSLDEIINAYLYALGRARKKEYEMQEIVEAIKRSKLKTD